MVETVLTVGVIVIMFSLLIPAANKMTDKVKISKVRLELQEIAHKIDLYQVEQRRFPDSLQEALGMVPLDPWQNPYQYLKLPGGVKNIQVKQRRKINDRLNSDYDLYSMGPDRQSQAPMTAAASRDDIVRAKNGNYFGNAADY